MDTVTYPESRVAQMISENFIPAKVKVKKNPDLAKEYLASWTPNVVLCDDQGKIHYRIEGFLPPEEFMAQLSLCLGRYRLDRQQFDKAAERFEEVAQRHQGSDAGAAALYWLGVAWYKQSKDFGQLRSAWDELAQRYPDSEWTQRSKIPDVK